VRTQANVQIETRIEIRRKSQSCMGPERSGEGFVEAALLFDVKRYLGASDSESVTVYPRCMIWFPDPGRDTECLLIGLRIQLLVTCTPEISVASRRGLVALQRTEIGRIDLALLL